MIDVIDEIICRLMGTTTVIWFVMYLSKMLATPFLWATPAKSIETIMGIFIMLIGPASLFLYITFDEMSKMIDKK